MISGGDDDVHGGDERPPARGRTLRHGVDNLQGRNGGNAGGAEKEKKDYSCSGNSIKHAVYPNTVQNLNTSPAALLFKSVIARKWRRELENRIA